MNVPINPETKIGVLLDAYPGIEEVLIAWTPAFARLRNPVLRKTVAKVATLEQAARIGGVSLPEMVRKLREAACGDASGIMDTPERAAGANRPADAPAWLSEEHVRQVIDADTMLENGVHPIGKLRECVVTLQAGEIVELTSSFLPAPLIEAMTRSGLAVYSHQISPGRHATFFCRQVQDPEPLHSPL